MKKKKVVTMILSFVLICSFLTGCGNKQETAAPAEGTGSSKTETQPQTSSKEQTQDKEQIEASIWVSLNGNATSVVQSYNEVLSLQKFFEITGLQLNFQHPSTGQENEQFNLLIAAPSNLPDMVDYDWMKNYPGGPQQAINDGIIISLNDYIDYMPNYKKLLEENELFNKECRTESGDIYAIRGIKGGSAYCYSGLLIRKDWLEELNLEVPKTIEDWEVMLKAFQEKKGAEYPLGLKLEEVLNVNTFSNAFSVGVDYYLDDNGKVVYGPTQEGYKQYVELLKKWYDEGFLDPDLASLDGLMVEAGFLNGDYGVCFSWIGGGIGKYYNATEDENFDVVLVNNPLMNESNEYMFMPYVASSGIATGGQLAITKNCKNVEKVLAALDYFYSQEGMLLKNFGVEGTTYEMVDGVPTYTDLIMHNPDGLAIGQAMAKYFQGNYGFIGYNDMDEYLQQYYAFDAQKEAIVTANQYAASALKHCLPAASPSADESAELAIIQTEINTYKGEMLVEFLTGAESLDNFDGFLNRLREMNIDRAVEIKQHAVDSFNTR